VAGKPAPLLDAHRSLAVKKLARLPKLRTTKTRLRHKVSDVQRGRQKGAPAVIKPDLERQAWPKDKVYICPENGPQEQATLPERRVLWWLLYKSGLKPGRWAFQSDFMQRQTLWQNNPVADFVIYKTSGGVMVWEVLGWKWHGTSWQRQRDYARRILILSRRHRGLPVTDYIEIWDKDINFSDSRRDRVCEAAMEGVEMGR